ncbi:MAG: acyltransferase [Alteromonadaceae bacterium]|nr:acyltransferase [Alteromonadaceae bacterium]
MRDAYFDKIKGISILAVIVIHAVPKMGGSSAGTFLPPEVIVRMPTFFAVFLFLALSGYFVGQSARAGKTFRLQPRLVRILIPYLIATIITVPVMRPELATSAGGLARAFLAGRGIGIGYYIIVLLQFCLLTPLLLRLRSPGAHAAVMAVGTLAGVLWTYGTAFNLPDSVLNEFPYTALPFWVWYPSYHLGLLLGQRPAPKTSARGILGLAVVLSLLLCYLEAYWLQGIGFEGMANSQLKASSLLYAVMVTLFVLLARGGDGLLKGEGGLLARLGEVSFFIYLYHLPLVFIFRGVLRKATGSDWLAIILAIPLAALVLLVLSMVIRRIIGTRAAAKYFGA